MTNLVLVSDAFKKEAKRLVKKYSTLQDSINGLILVLAKDPFAGDAYGDGIYKIRLADKSKGKGKSGGFRIMYYHVTKTADGINILMMSIYDKSEKSTIKKADAVKILKEILDDFDRKG